MFNIGDLIVYGNIGVCRVESIGPSEISGAEAGKDYYGLTPYYSGRSKIFIPCDSCRIVMRRIITRKEAEDIISEIPDIDGITVDDEKNRELIYKNTIKGCDLRSIIGLIKTIYERKVQRIAEGKKVTSSDEKYFIMAEDKLYGELAIALDLPKEKVRDHIKECIEA